MSYWQADEGSSGTATTPVVAAIKAKAEGSSIEQIQRLLGQAETAHHARSAVVYALFVPQEQTPGPAFGAVQTAAIALTRRLQTPTARDDDQLLLVMVPPMGQPIQQLVDVTRKELIQQGQLFRMAVSDPEDDQSYRSLARQIHGWLFMPLADEFDRLELDMSCMS